MYGRRRRAKGGRRVLAGAFCIYCGVTADSREHWPPVATSHAPGGFILPACRECNTLGGDFCPADFAARVDYVKGKLAARYRKVIGLPRWTESELAELSPAMAESLRSTADEQAQIKARLDWDSFRYLASLQ